MLVHKERGESELWKENCSRGSRVVTDAHVPSATHSWRTSRQSSFLFFIFFASSTDKKLFSFVTPEQTLAHPCVLRIIEAKLIITVGLVQHPCGTHYRLSRLSCSLSFFVAFIFSSICPTSSVLSGVSRSFYLFHDTWSLRDASSRGRETEFTTLSRDARLRVSQACKQAALTCR